MKIIKEDNRVGPAVCCVCGKDAKINDSGKWYSTFQCEIASLVISPHTHGS